MSLPKYFEHISIPKDALQLGLSSRKTFLFGLSGIIVTVSMLSTGYGLISTGWSTSLILGITTSAAFIAVAVYVKFSNRLDGLSYLTTIFCFSTLLYVFYYNSNSSVNLIWMPIFPIIAFFLVGRLSGAIWSCLFILGLVFLLILNSVKVLTILYPTSDLIIVFSATCLTIFAVYLYEEVSEKAFAKSSEQSLLIEKADAILRKENIELAENERMLAHSVEQSDKSRLAITNLLEDEKELESELRQQKTSVEHTVEQRTKELSGERAKLLSSINSLRSGFIITDNNGNVDTTNDYAKRLIWMPNENLPTLNSEEVALKNLSIEDLEEYLKDIFPIRQHIQDSLEKREILIFRDVQVKNKHLDFYIAPIIVNTPNPETIGTVITIHDISEQKILERSRDEFFSIASHELRTPLTSIRGNSSLIESYFADKMTDPDLKEMVGDIHESSIRLLGIVNDFLNVSRLEQKRMVYANDEISLRELVDKTIKELEKTVKEGVKLLVEENNKLPNITADSNKVQEVLINLIGNAVKFTEQGYIKVKLEQIGDQVKVSIEDSGKGISEENSALLFRKFQQAGSSILTRDSTRGTGLGLYISRMMVEGMGGKIGIESSTPGKGSTFAFTLPLTPPEANLKKPETDPNSDAATTSAAVERV